MLDSQEKALVKIDVARKALAEAKNIPDVKKIRDQASTVEHYMRRQQYSLEAIADASELKLRAERRLGELLPRADHGGDRRSSSVVKLELPDGISKGQAHRWQTVADVPEPEFEEHVADAREQAISLTTAGVMRVAKRAERVEHIQQIVTHDAPLTDLAPVPILYADPPWQYEHVKTENRAIENQYPTLSLEEICALPVSNAASADAVLFLWATSPKLSEAMQVVTSWGFVYRTCMVWVKDKIGMGYYARQQHELLLIAARGDLPVPEPANRPASVVTADRGEHSAKPPIFYELIERMYPEFPKRELFLRGEPRPGWSGWGNQAA